MDPYTATVLLLTEIVKAYNNQSQATKDAEAAAFQANLDEWNVAGNTGLKLVGSKFTLPRIIVYMPTPPKVP